MLDVLLIELLTVLLDVTVDEDLTTFEFDELAEKLELLEVLD